jgi:hypothetical protein
MRPRWLQSLRRRWNLLTGALVIYRLDPANLDVSLRRVRETLE